MRWMLFIWSLTTFSLTAQVDPGAEVKRIDTTVNYIDQIEKSLAVDSADGDSKWRMRVRVGHWYSKYYYKDQANTNPIKIVHKSVGHSESRFHYRDQKEWSLYYENGKMICARIVVSEFRKFRDDKIWTRSVYYKNGKVIFDLTPRKWERGKYESISAIEHYAIRAVKRHRR
ncbi:hypothetical protein JYT21_00450 [bacterium AH-315-B15]|nr:hypothetical protein [bacterium AH-315-B15]